MGAGQSGATLVASLLHRLIREIVVIHSVYLGLGSNLGDRAANLRAALAALDALDPAVRVTRVSSVYATAPMYVVDQPEFYNAVCHAQTTLAPLDLLGALKRLERTLGRTPGRRFGPRVVDLDLLLYDDLTLHIPPTDQTGELVVPHQRMLERAFVLVPLAEIAPDLVLPSGQTVAAVARHLDAAGVRRIGPLLRGTD